MIEQTFPGVHQEVMMLIHLLRTTSPSLAEVLTWGIIGMLTPATRSPSAAIALAYRQAVLRAVAHDQDGARVPFPHDQPGSVTHLEIVDLAVAGRSCLGAAG
ncbi:hypothetical protein AB0J55_06275 [Amycolatopsis sp. NPDC049688]|uniref:hypothetical protein n=1 Tax=Amycolatopsis sp. NPDC049688 TaxID=3154733 RepID=UPI0034297302